VNDDRYAEIVRRTLGGADKEEEFRADVMKAIAQQDALMTLQMKQIERLEQRIKDLESMQAELIVLSRGCDKTIAALLGVWAQWTREGQQ
jgi:hypothetical protein